MNARAQNMYINTQVNTAHPGELTLMLYNGSLKFMRQAMENIENKNIEARNNNIKRALDIIDELQITLNMKYEISQNLFSLYVFMKEKLTEANMRMDKESLQVSMNLMVELRDTWIQALKQVKSQNTQ
ncbi:flagellar protein FliS [Paenibacillus baekrokdamisoli]|uniref:Flagellar secretion chaperone FliS n=1 Tax=Paenibacillus baekrokdamisoli TaxID=1712516 RepID=A0A3G9IZC1_9BACL|nr:flagellar export chaperone FliS [Paenibacillus baekrokdamisoli]MBB3069102.1 flagellar protein FliS [Paenibacillus baekrokdamisoli]BBH23916.1 flagellar protein FliS [Paenibacillus baekrokdamisoli]